MYERVLQMNVLPLVTTMTHMRDLMIIETKFDVGDTFNFVEEGEGIITNIRISYNDYDLDSTSRKIEIFYLIKIGEEILPFSEENLHWTCK